MLTPSSAVDASSSTKRPRGPTRQRGQNQAHTTPKGSDKPLAEGSLTAPSHPRGGKGWGTQSLGAWKAVPRASPVTPEGQAPHEVETPHNEPPRRPNHKRTRRPRHAPRPRRHRPPLRRPQPRSRRPRTNRQRTTRPQQPSHVSARGVLSALRACSPARLSRWPWLSTIRASTRSARTSPR